MSVRFKNNFEETAKRSNQQAIEFSKQLRQHYLETEKSSGAAIRRMLILYLVGVALANGLFNEGRVFTLSVEDLRYLMLVILPLLAFSHYQAACYVSLAGQLRERLAVCYSVTLPALHRNGEHHFLDAPSIYSFERVRLHRLLDRSSGFANKVWICLLTVAIPIGSSLAVIHQSWLILGLELNLSLTLPAVLVAAVLTVRALIIWARQ